ncbi:MAG: hypothetical protein ACLTHL_03035, partial [Collinsella sp.]
MALPSKNNSVAQLCVFCQFDKPLTETGGVLFVVGCLHCVWVRYQSPTPRRAASVMSSVGNSQLS